MNKERIKSIVLVFLVMTNCVLGIKILTDKKLWPDGYNFFVSLGNYDIVRAFQQGSEENMTKTHLNMPEQIIINTGDQTSRIAVSPDEDIFSDIFDAARDAIASALRASGTEIFFSPESEWVSAINAESVYLSYAVPYETALFGEFFGVDASELAAAVPSLSRLVISTDRNVFFENYITGDFYRVRISRDLESLISIIGRVKNSDSGSGAIINYSVDLKFNEASGGQKAVLSPTVPVYSTPVRMPRLTVRNPLTDESGHPDREIIEKILNIFKINTNTVYRYTEVNGTMVYVENNGILKIMPEGIIYYQSTDSDGFYLSSGNSFSESVSALADFADSVNAAASSTQDMYVSSVLLPSDTTITFDYRAAGAPITIDCFGRKNAVTAEMENGALKSYIHVLKSYVPSEETYETPAFIESLDQAIETYSNDLNNNIEIRKMYLAYTDDGTNSVKSADWHTQIKSIIINEEELT